ncbi:MAG: hypothetical protein M1839_007196 [Geoglossum umbratile]|nr:MAG: hypothetical protein M1839_007196 [Geoglossum umbratile]
MLLNNTYNDSTSYEPTPAANADIDSVIDDVSRQLAFSKMIRRQFRDSCSPAASYGQRNGMASRVMKPTSAGNSPSRVDRRRTMFLEPTSRTRSTLYNHFENMFNLTSSKDGFTPETPRPVSWQPTSQQGYWGPSHQIHHNSLNEISMDYQFPTGSLDLTYLEEPEAPSSFPYSNPVSPLAPIPPSEVPFPLYGEQIYGLPDTCYIQQDEVVHSDVRYPMQVTSDPLPLQATQTLNDGPFDQCLPLDDSQQDWSQFVYGSGAFFPSTPPSQNSLPLQSPLPLAQARADSSLQSNPESHGGTKELVGMGLYDAPDSSTPALEPDDYRNSIISTLSYLDQDCPGKGLKLEETWKPAESDEDDDDGDDDDDDDDKETCSTDGSQDGPCSTEERQDGSLNNAMADNSMILPHDGLFDEEAYLAASAFLAQSKTQSVGFDGLSWI